MDSAPNTTTRHPVAYLKIIFRRKWLFISPIFVGFVLGIIALFLIPPTYESATVILVDEEKIINPLIQGLAVATSVSQRIRTIKEQILSWNSLVELAKKLNLDKNAQSQAQFEKLIMGLRDRIIVQMRGTNIIRLSYQGEDRQQTQLIAKTLSDIFIEENMRQQTKETDVAIEFIKDQLKLYKRKIKESEIAQMEDTLKNLLIDSTDLHPMVKELRSRIGKAKTELETLEFKVTGVELPKGSPVYDALKKELDKITQDSSSVTPEGQAAFGASSGQNNDPNAAIYKVLLMDKLDSVLARDMSVNENIYNMLLQKLETAKITQRLETSKEGTRYTIIDPPRLPLKPVKPNKAMVLVMALFLGGFAGIGLVVGREFLDHSILDIDDAKQSLNLPILGAISRITTPEEVEKEKQKQKMAISVVVISSVVCIILVMLVSFLLK